jgi:aminoglycoside phosphotransferase (APT) family kinase protein
VGSRTFAGTGRGGDLKTHDEWVETCLQHSERLLDVGVLREMWKELRELPRNSIDLMTHGDLIPSNVLAAGGRLVGVIDVGGLGPADPALDLVGAWHMLERGPREAFRGALRCDDVQWERGKAWALQQALGLVWYYLDSLPDISSMGQRTLQRLVADRATA